MGSRRRAIIGGALLVAGCSRHPAPAPSSSAASAEPPPAATDAGSDAASAEDTDPRFPGHVAALAWEVKVHAQPSLQSPMVGYVRAGGVVAAGSAAVSRDGCAGGWYAVAPEGFVCVETNVATTDLAQPIVRALAQRPDRSARLPYMYGLVHQHSPIYSRVPTRAEAAHSEYSLRQHMEHWLRAKDGARVSRRRLDALEERTIAGRRGALGRSHHRGRARLARARNAASREPLGPDRRPPARRRADRRAPGLRLHRHARPATGDATR